MFILGHIGFSVPIFKKAFPELSIKALAFGAVAPDLLDKCLFYGAYYSVESDHWIRQLITGSRTFGHSGIFLVSFGLISILSKRMDFIAFSFGVMSHVVLDLYGCSFENLDQHSMTYTILFPFVDLPQRVIQAPFVGGIGGHIEHSSGRPLLWVAEGIGLLFLAVFLFLERKKAL